MSDSEDAGRASSDERVERAREFLEGILDRMDIDADVVVREREDRVLLEIECDDVQRVIGRRGHLVDALQHLVAKRVAKLSESESRGKPIVVDAGGYREREIERLESLADKMARKALRDGAPVELSPMSPHDRRVVHMAIAEMGGVVTRSEGEGDLRHVVVVPDPEDERQPSPLE